MEPTAVIRIAVDALTALSDGDAVRASKRFGDEMRAGLPPAKLADMWEQFQRDHGTFVKRGAAAVEQRGRIQLCVIRLAFDRAAADLLVGIDPGGKIVGFYLNPHVSTDEQVRAVASARRHVWLSIPIAGAIIAAAIAAVGRFDVSAAAVGVVGWSVAMLLRFPALVLARYRKRTEDQIEAMATQAVGPLAEAARLGALAFVSTTAVSAASLGIGWAAIEALFASLTALGAFRSATGDSDEAARVRGVLLQRRVRATPLWASVEQVAAVAFHVGASLLLVFEPTLVIPVAIAHLVYVVAPTRIRATSIMRADALALGIAVVVLGAGVALNV